MDKNFKLDKTLFSNNKMNEIHNNNLLNERDFAKDLPDPTRFFKNKLGKPDFSSIEGQCENGRCDVRSKKKIEIEKEIDDTNKISDFTFDNILNAPINNNLLNDRNFGLSYEHKINNNMFTNDIQSLDKYANGTDQFGISLSNNKLSLKTSIYLQHYYNDFVYSSYGLLSAMVMYYIGSSDETEKEITNALNLHSKNDAYNSLIKLNSSLAHSNSINVANCIFLDDRFDVNKKYKQFILKLGIFNKVDTSNPIQVCKQINDYIAVNTGNKITEMIYPNVINDSTKIILTNAIYFKSNWKIAFNKSDTADELFSAFEKNKIIQKEVRMMNLYDKQLYYTETKTHKLLELEYIDNEFVFGVWLPKKIEKSIVIPSTKELMKSIDHLYKTYVNLKLPTFSKELTYNVVPFFKFLGMNLCFTNKCHTYSISEKYPLPIAIILHKAKIEIDETGTEARTDSTVIVCDEVCMDTASNSVKEFYANKPFIYYIRHISTNSILFMGKYT